MNLGKIKEGHLTLEGDRRVVWGLAPARGKFVAVLLLLLLWLHWISESVNSSDSRSVLHGVDAGSRSVFFRLFRSSPHGPSIYVYADIKDLQ